MNHAEIQGMTTDATTNETRKRALLEAFIREQSNADMDALIKAIAAPEKDNTL